MEGHLLLAVIHEETERRRRSLRVMRRRLRDHHNPFDIMDDDFVKLYRLPKEGVRYIVEEIAEVTPATGRFTAIPTHIRVLACLHFLACGSYQRRIGQDFLHALSQSSISYCVTNTCNAITYRLLDKWIKFPRTAQEVQVIKERFMEKTNMPGVIGAIDATHVAIVPPTAAREHLFLNTKHFHSKNVQIVCDFDLKILGLNAKYGGSTHDAHIWRCSLLRRYLCQQYVSGERSNWLIGDSGYPNEPWLMTTITNAEANTPEARFNSSHMTARNCVERCIGVWKGWFRCLRRDRTLHWTPERAGYIINACAVMHNMALHYRVPFTQNIQPEVQEINLIAAGDIDVTREGNNIRESIVINHFQ